MHTPRRHRLVLAVCALLSTLPARAADESLRPIAFQNGVNQQQLGAETAELARAINQLIDELQRNGFPVQSLSGLTELAAQLNTLGGTEMNAIAARLRKLGENAQADPRATASEAYLAQQAIETRLKSLARQISIQQLREETARRLEALITRQLAAQRETRAIASAKADANRHRLLESDQAGIGDDLSTFFQTGENLLARLREKDAPAGAPASSSAAPAAEQSFTERINGAYLTKLSGEALEQLKGRRYPEAYARQDALLAELRKLLQGILSSLPKDQRLASALQQVSALRQQLEADAKSDHEKTAEEKKAAADQARTLADQVASVSPEASKALREAEKAIENPPADNPQRPQQSNQQQQPEANQQANNQQQNGQQQQQQNNQNQQAQNQPQNQQGQQQQQNGQQQNDQNTPSAQQSLAAAEKALAQALADAQNANNNQQQNGQQQANNQQQQGQQQQQNGQNQQGQNQQGQNQQAQNQQGQNQQGQQQNGQGQPQQTASQPGLNGQPPSPDQKDGNLQGSGSGDAQDQIANSGPDAKGPAQAVGALRRDEREAFTALQGERYPAEYSAWVQQYWRNLAQEQ